MKIDCIDLDSFMRVSDSSMCVCVCVQLLKKHKNMKWEVDPKDYVLVLIVKSENLLL